MTSGNAWWPYPYHLAPSSSTALISNSIATTNGYQPMTIQPLDRANLEPWVPKEIRQPVDCAYHLQFIEFPNARPQPTMQARPDSIFWPVLDTLDKWVSADGDDEVEIASAAMEMVDYAIEHAPDLFGVDMAQGIYATLDQELELLEKIMECVDGKDYCDMSDRGVYAKWYQDAVLVGHPQHRIVVRVSYHEGRS